MLPMLRSIARVLLLTATFVGVVACTVGMDETANAEADITSAPLSLLTYNMGLAHGYVALADERLEVLPKALKEEHADVLCLQELWTDEDYERVTSELRDVYPHAFRERTDGAGHMAFACNPLKLFSLKSCVDDKCTPNGISGEKCIGEPCKEQYGELSDKCKLCIAANTSSPIGCSLIGAKEYANDGRNGLAVFSRHPIESASYKAFDTLVVKRGVITAKVQGRTVQCTHMTAELNSVPYPKDKAHGSWKAEHAAQIKGFDEAAPGPGCRVLLGDLNTGPTLPGLGGELEENYKSLLANGWRDAWATPACTWCADNPLSDGSTNRFIDHAMLKNCGAQTAEVRRAMDRPTKITADGTVHETRLSDHYGLFVQLR
jgi:endonuclease/exonuclease/phosphatase family metal-dependent hydrolase